MTTAATPLDAAAAGETETVGCCNGNNHSSDTTTATVADSVAQFHADGYVIYDRPLFSTPFVQQLRTECLDIFHSTLQYLHLIGHASFSSASRRCRQQNHGKAGCSTEIISQAAEELKNITTEELSSSSSSSTNINEGNYEYPIKLGVKNGYQELVMRSPGRYELALLVDKDCCNNNCCSCCCKCRLDGIICEEKSCATKKCGEDGEDGLSHQLMNENNSCKICHTNYNNHNGGFSCCCCYYDSKRLISVDMIKKQRIIKQRQLLCSSSNNTNSNLVSSSLSNDCSNIDEKEREEEESATTTRSNQRSSSCLQQLLGWIKKYEMNSCNNSNSNINNNDDSSNYYDEDERNMKSFMELVSAIFPPDNISNNNNNIISNEYYLCNFSLLISTPGSPTQSWHADGGHTSLTTHLPCHVFNVFIPLIDVPLSMGPTEFRPGSHVYTRDLIRMMLLAKIKKRLRKTVVPELKCGEALLFDYRILHRGRANLSDRDGEVIQQDEDDDNLSDGNDGDKIQDDEEEDDDVVRGNQADRHVTVGEDNTTSTGTKSCHHGRDRPVLVMTFARRWYVDVCNFPKRSIFSLHEEYENEMK